MIAAAGDGAADRLVTVPLRDRKMEFKGRDYLVGWVLPNLYFHLTTAYAILRHNGVELGKNMARSIEAGADTNRDASTVGLLEAIEAMATAPRR